MKRRCRFYLLVTRKRHHIHCPPFTTLKAVICFCREYVTWFFCIVPTGEPMFHNIPARVLSCSLITSCVLQIHVKIKYFTAHSITFCCLSVEKKQFSAPNVLLRCTDLRCHCSFGCRHAHWSATTTVTTLLSTNYMMLCISCLWNYCVIHQRSFNETLC